MWFSIHPKTPEEKEDKEKDFFLRMLNINVMSFRVLNTIKYTMMRFYLSAISFTHTHTQTGK